MDIMTYLHQTIPDIQEPDLTTEQPLLKWMIESLSEFSMANPVDVVPVSSSDTSHKYVHYLGRHYIVWDVALNDILWHFLVGMQYERLANGLGKAQDSERFRALASAIFRHTIFHYIARKLARFPHTAGAFIRLANEEPVAMQGVPIPEDDLILELLAMQKLLMFYHEINHAVHIEREDLHSQSIIALTRLLEHLPEIVGDEFALAADLDIAFPEFATLSHEQRLGHFAEELDCDLQAFIFASMAIPNAPGIPQRAWQDSIGILFGASALLATLERTLKLAVSKWGDFARESSDCAELTTRSIMLEQYLENRPLFYLRRWNTMIATNAVLERLGKARTENAFAWEEYVIEKMQGMIDVFDEYLVRELNNLATPEFIAKVFARGSILDSRK